MLLVGDSLNQVIAGQETTLSATLDQMIYHAAAVRRGAPRVARVRGPAVPHLPGVGARGDPERGPRAAGDRRARGQARGRPAHGGDRARAGGPGHSGDRATSASRRSRCTRWAATGCRGATRPRPSGCSPTPARWRRRAPCAHRARAGARRRWRGGSPTSLTIPTIGIGAGRRLRRAGAGAARHAGPQRGVQSEVPQALRRAGRGGARRRSGPTPPRCADGRYPGPEHSFE